MQTLKLHNSVSFDTPELLLKVIGTILIYCASNRKKAPHLTMEVTADNFHEVLPVVEKAIEDATFVAIDGEFTGLSLGTEGTPQNAMDTAEERYAKVQLYRTYSFNISISL